MRKDQVLITLCLGYIGGVLAGSFFVVAWWMVILFLTLGIALTAVFFRGKVFLLTALFAIFVYGIFSVTQSLNQFRAENMQGQAVSGIARVVNDPEEKSFYRSVVLRMESCASEYCPREKILWQAPLASETVFGARVSFA